MRGAGSRFENINKKRAFNEERINKLCVLMINSLFNIMESSNKQHSKDATLENSLAPNEADMKREVRERKKSQIMHNINKQTLRRLSSSLPPDDQHSIIDLNIDDKNEDSNSISNNTNDFKSSIHHSDEIIGSPTRREVADIYRSPKKGKLLTNTLSKEDYSFYYESSVWDQYEDFVYAIQRGRTDKVIMMAKREGISVYESLRPVSYSL